MDRTDSLPALSERGRGLAELKGHDPLDRRLEVEKKERYAQALREQMAYNAANRGNTPDTESAGALPWGMNGLTSGVTGLPPALPLASSPGGLTRRSRGNTPLTGVHDQSLHTADRLAEVQDVMRQRMQMLQEEQHRQWQTVQAALAQQLIAARDAADQAVAKQLEAANEAHAIDLRKALAELGSARHESAAASQRVASLAGDLAAVRREHERSSTQGREDQHKQMQSMQAALQQQMAGVREAAEHAVRLQLEAASKGQAAALRQALAEVDAARREAVVAEQRTSGLQEEVAVLRREQQRLVALGEDLTALRRNVERLTMQSKDHQSLLEVHTAEIERLKLAHQDCARFQAEVLREQRSLCDAASRLNAEFHEVSRQNQEAARQMQQYGGALERLHVARQEDQRALGELAREQRAAAEAMAQLRVDQQELSRRANDVPGQFRKLHEELQWLAAQGAHQVFEKHIRPSAEQAPLPSPQLIFPAEVSEEAFAVLRNSEGELYELPALHNTVGRSAACNVCIASSQAVSNRHASVDIDREGKSSVKDLGSRNGTFLNDHRVPQDAGLVLQSGDSVRLGVDGPTYTFEFGPAYYARWPREPERVRAGRGTASASPALRRHSPNR